MRELYTLVSYTLKNANNAYTAHPALDNTSYWSSTQRASSTTNAWRVGFTNGITYYGTKTSSSRVVCVHD
ncbi:MAG: DUF1566 domain-containing protein [Candidatus Peribacteria bacterium]|nr:DUF1566 domain-containing protein [Candidatus Peribacteria bacterium]